MRTTAILNMKGGVAKTTTAVNMAAILAHDYHKRVLVVDADAQCNTTEFFEAEGTAANTFADLLRSQIDFNLPLIVESTFPGVYLLKADESLMDLDLSKAGNGAADVLSLRNIVQKVDKPWVWQTGPVKDPFDYILIDCPPAFNAAAMAALVAADDVLIPMKLDAFAIRGMANLTRQIMNMRRVNKNLKVAGILPTMWYKSDDTLKAEEMLTASGLPVCPHIRTSKTVDRMTYRQEPLVSSSASSGAALVDYRRFVNNYVRGDK